MVIWNQLKKWHSLPHPLPPMCYKLLMLYIIKRAFSDVVCDAVPDGAVSKGESKLGVTFGKKALSGRRSYKSYMHTDITTSPTLKSLFCVVSEPLVAPNRPANLMKLHRGHALLFLCIVFFCLWPLWDFVFLETIFFFFFMIQFGACQCQRNDTFTFMKSACTWGFCPDTLWRKQAVKTCTRALRARFSSISVNTFLHTHTHTHYM